MSNVTPWRKDGPAKAKPRRIKRPCDWGLELTVIQLETQLGTVEAYNRIVDAAKYLQEKINAGHAKSQNPLFAVSVNGSSPNQQNIKESS